MYKWIMFKYYINSFVRKYRKVTVTQYDLSRLTRQLILMSTVFVITVELKNDRVISIDFTNVTSRVAIIAWKCAFYRCRSKRKKQTEIREIERKMYFQCVYKYSHARESSFIAPAATWLPHGNKTNISILFDWSLFDPCTISLLKLRGRNFTIFITDNTYIYITDNTYIYNKITKLRKIINT